MLILLIFVIVPYNVLGSDFEGYDPTGGVSETKKLKIVDTYKAPSCSMETQEHDLIYWNYKGMLLNGHVFDSGQFHARIGHGDVITGVDKGMRGLCVGDKRRMTMHHDWAYGERGVPGTIPPLSALIFDVELLSIDRPGIGKVTKEDIINTQTSSEESNTGGVSKENKLKITELYQVEDCTLRSQQDDTIYWHYKGTFLDGTEFHSGDFRATLGHGHVIVGVDKGMRGLCVGDKRRLVIHSDWAYGDDGRPGSIPPKATLVFDVEMKKIERPDSSSKSEL